MTDLSKPVGAGLGWQRRDTRYLYRSGWYDVRQDDVTLPSGEDIASELEAFLREQRRIQAIARAFAGVQ